MDLAIQPLTKLAMLFLLLFLGLATTLVGSVESITGQRQACSNEGEEVSLGVQTFECFRCICQNGFVECEPDNCPHVEDCYMLEKKPIGGCCEKCKECIYKGVRYSSGMEWSSANDSCKHLKCIAGVITETNVQCYTPCNNPLPQMPGQCCPTCLGCNINGQTVLDMREVTLIEDPCLKCHCSNNRLTCLKKACPVLQCPLSKQIQLIGECCPRCTERREIMQVPGKCILGQGFHSDGKQFNPDRCSRCTCVNGTSVCFRDTCPVLECSPEYQKLMPDECCPTCPPLLTEIRSTCVYQNKTFENNEIWKVGPCQSCRCYNGEIHCAQIKCEIVKCKPNEILTMLPGQCCSKCVESAGICTVFGDPHYKTFDGKFFSFQGSCKYQLVSDCQDHKFSIRVTNDGRYTNLSAWTKTVTIKLEGIRVNLGQKLRVKVNSTRVKLPFEADGLLQVVRLPEGLLITTEIGIQVEWDGNHFLQIQVPTRFKNKLCGLCGNYNGIGRDDLMSRDGRNHTENDVWRFANSWKVGGLKACNRKHENLAKIPTCRQRKDWLSCKALKESHIFGDCDSILNPYNYFESCKMDMCECPSRFCYCESFAAYAHECQRLGVILPDWRQETHCSLDIQTNHSINQRKRDHEDKYIEQRQFRYQRCHRKKSRCPDYYREHFPKALLIHKSTSRKPSPLH